MPAGAVAVQSGSLLSPAEWDWPLLRLPRPCAASPLYPPGVAATPRTTSEGVANVLSKASREMARATGARGAFRSWAKRRAAAAALLLAGFRQLPWQSAPRRGPRTPSRAMLGNPRRRKKRVANSTGAGRERLLLARHAWPVLPAATLARRLTRRARRASTRPGRRGLRPRCFMLFEHQRRTARCRR